MADICDVGRHCMHRVLFSPLFVINIYWLLNNNSHTNLQSHVADENIIETLPGVFEVPEIILILDSQAYM